MKRPSVILCLLLGSPAFAANNAEPVETVEAAEAAATTESVEAAEAAGNVAKWRTYQLTFTTATRVSNPFDTYLLKLRLIRPDGSTLEVEGFYDDLDGTAPFTWRVRLCPDQAGDWSWSTIAGDAPARWNEAGSGSFKVVDVGDPGPLTTDGRSFKWSGTDQPVYVYGNFLDESAGNQEEKYSHVYFSDELTPANRARMRARQQVLWGANKVDIYYANNGDGDFSTIPWVGTESAPNYAAMSLRKWAEYDTHLKDWKAAGALVWMWFFADESGFDRLTPAQRERLVRYAMARHSAYSHLSFVMALETNESGQLSTSMVERLGAYTETKNPWRRLLSSHQMQSYGDGQAIGCTAILSDQPWMDFYASQIGNSSNSGDASRRRRVFECGKTLYDHFADRPHASEEFGICSGDAHGQNATCRELTWGAFLSGAGAGVGTDFQNLTAFITASRVPFQRMKPDASILSGGTASGYARYQSGQHYLVYKTTSASSITVTTTGSGLTGRWWDPADRHPSLSPAFAVVPGTASYTPPSHPGRHWVLWITSGDDLNTVRLHPDPQLETAPSGKSGNSGNSGRGRNRPEYLRRLERP